LTYAPAVSRHQWAAQSSTSRDHLGYADLTSRDKETGAARSRCEWCGWRIRGRHVLARSAQGDKPGLMASISELTRADEVTARGQPEEKSVSSAIIDARRNANITPTGCLALGCRVERARTARLTFHSADASNNRQTVQRQQTPQCWHYSLFRPMRLHPPVQENGVPNYHS
jgi:hypothetical protein